MRRGKEEERQGEEEKLNTEGREGKEEEEE